MCRHERVLWLELLGIVASCLIAVWFLAPDLWPSLADVLRSPR